jgi:hypothetical protein
MKTIIIIIVLLLFIGILFVIPTSSQLLLLLQDVFAQIGASEQMMSHMRLTHSQLANNIDEVKQLLETNHTSEAFTLLDGMDIKINHMNTMFNDLVWELSNRGH